MIPAVVLTTGELFTLDEGKAHLNVTVPDDDVLIQTYIDAAVQSCLKACNLALVPQGAEPTFKVAAMLTMGSFYNNRETLLVGQTLAVSPMVDEMLYEYKLIRV